MPRQTLSITFWGYLIAMTKRDPYFDVVKAFAMLLVVAGHTRWAYGCQVGNPPIDNFIVGMNMPVFFMISGYFAAKTIWDGDWRKLAKHIVGYFWPLAVASCIFAVLAVLLNIDGSEKGLIGYAGRYFLFPLWYLWCLAICFVVTFLTACIPKISPLVAVIGIYCVLLFLKGVWYIGNVRAMLPHFLFGLFVLRKWPLWKNRLLGAICLLAYLIFVVTSNSFRLNGLSFYTGATDWSSFVAEPINIVLLFARTLLGFVGSVGIMWLICEIVCKFPDVGILLSPLGKTTLGVYIFHQWILARCVEYLPIGSSFVATLGFAFILFGVCHYITIVLKLIPWLRRIVWGLWWER